MPIFRMLNMKQFTLNSSFSAGSSDYYGVRSDSLSKFSRTALRIFGLLKWFYSRADFIKTYFDNFIVFGLLGVLRTACSNLKSYSLCERAFWFLKVQSNLFVLKQFTSCHPAESGQKWLSRSSIAYWATCSGPLQSFQALLPRLLELQDLKALRSHKNDCLKFILINLNLFYNNVLSGSSRAPIR